MKTNEIVCKIFKTLELWFTWSFRDDTNLRFVNSISDFKPEYMVRRAAKDVIWITSDELRRRVPPTEVLGLLEMGPWISVERRQNLCRAFSDLNAVT